MRSFHQIALVLSVILLSLSPSQAGHENPRARRRHTNKLTSTFDSNHKRDANVAFTYFVDGQGACGANNGPSDFIVALNSAEYAGGAHCFDMITITINGKTAQAQITDECPGCSEGGLDFSQGLFEYFAPLSEGELHGSWSYNSDATTSSSTPTPTTTSSTPAWTPTTTVATTATLSSSTSVSTTIATSSTSTVASSSTSPVQTSTPQNPQVLAQINLALLELGVLLQGSFELEA